MTAVSLSGTPSDSLLASYQANARQPSLHSLHHSALCQELL
jgi:hypothetical protein